jgi:hypothetical protein
MLDKAEAAHPTLAELSDYEAGNLPPFVQAWVEEHIVDCASCSESLRRVEAFVPVWNAWNAHTHRVANLRSRVAVALASAEIEGPSDLRDRFRDWNTKWRGKVNGALRVVVGAAGAGSQLIAEGLESVLCPDFRMPAFAVSMGQPTRGAGVSPPIFADTAAVPGNPPTHVVLIGNELRVTVTSLLPGQKPPVVVLIPESAASPQAQRLVRDHREPVPSWVAVFPSVPPGPYTLTFLWF